MDRQQLRSPEGQLKLIGIVFITAIGLAIGMAANRWFFEKYVREKYAAPSAEAVSLYDRIKSGQADAKRLSTLPEEEKAGFYYAWMTRPEPGKESRIPGVLLQADRMYFRNRAEATLAGGSQEQKFRALEFIRASGDPDFLPALRSAAKRAGRSGNNPFLVQLSAVIRQLESDGARKD